MRSAIDGSTELLSVYMSLGASSGNRKIIVNLSTVILAPLDPYYPPVGYKFTCRLHESSTCHLVPVIKQIVTMSTLIPRTYNTI